MNGAKIFPLPEYSGGMMDLKKLFSEFLFARVSAKRSRITAVAGWRFVSFSWIASFLKSSQARKQFFATERAIPRVQVFRAHRSEAIWEGNTKRMFRSAICSLRVWMTTFTVYIKHHNNSFGNFNKRKRNNSHCACGKIQVLC